MMKAAEKTVEDSTSQEQAEEEGEGSLGQPGLVLVYSMGQPTFELLPLKDGQLELGRGDGRSRLPLDQRMSRRHARVAFDGHNFQIEDLGSQNGSFVDGKALHTKLVSESAQVLRTGETLFLLRPDLRPYAAGKMTIHEGRVIGPLLQQALDQIIWSVAYGNSLHIIGESGAGKEMAARVFHSSSSHSRGSFVGVNCAAIPEGLAERLLFGAKRGAFSGAVVDSDGYLQSADGGTLFLDEIAELDLSVQAKLLRVLETKEVCPLGATGTRPVKILLCSACNKDLRGEVAAGRFREDLYFRLSSPAVEIPPLRKRREEIPWLIAQALQEIGSEVRVAASFVEACLLRFWPGNIRELLLAIRAAVPRLLASNRMVLKAQHLDPMVGMAFAAVSPLADATVHEAVSNPQRETIERVLRRTSGNVSAAARLLGKHRNQLQRMIERFEIEPTRFAPNAQEADE